MKLKKASMSISDLLSTLRISQIDISLDGENLRVSSDEPEIPANLLELLKENKAAIIAYLKKQVGSQEFFSSIGKIPEQESYQLSRSQERLWILCQFPAINLAYTMNGAFGLSGQLDVGALTRSFSKIIDRHEILRTVFRLNDSGEIRQKVLEVTTYEFSFPLHDIRSTLQQNESIQALFKQQVETPFDLANGPLLRADLVQTADQQYVLLFTMHHIISDGWSMELLMKELFVLYHAYVSGKDNPLPNLTIQYKDYAAWQQEQLSGIQLAEHKNYWLNCFSGELPLLDMPLLNPRPAVQTFNGKKHRKVIGNQLFQQLKKLSGDQNATLFMNLIAGVNALLFKYCNQTDIILGSPIAGRQHPDLENQIGLYLNTLCLRTRFSEEDSFIDLLAKVREVTLGAYQHQIYPFDELVNELSLKRDISRNALFDVLVVLQNTAIASGGIEKGNLVNIEIGKYPITDDEISKFDISFIFEELEDQLQLTLEYNEMLYEQPFIAQLGEHFEQLFKEVVKNPQQPIGTLNLLCSEEKKLILEDFNDTLVVFPNKNKTLVDLFEEQVQRSPDAIALKFGQLELSFEQVNQLANKFSAYLKEYHQVNPKGFIGVKLERSQWLIIVLLAVLKTGNAYVPIDPSYPQDRINYIQEDAQLGLTIDQEHVDKFLKIQDQFDAKNPASLIGADDLAYVIYTSGSTGNPKGCMLRHDGVVNRIQWMWEQYDFTSKDVIFQKTTFTFDVSVWEIFMPLCWGTKMVLCEKEDVASPDRILQLIEKNGATCLHFVPSMLTTFMSHLFEKEMSAEQMKELRLVITSGEALSAETVSNWYEHLTIPIHNLYGPTEASIDVTHFTASKNDRKIPIGKPIANTQIYILNEQLQIVPIGCVGEIYIGGLGLAKGYLNKPELTKSQFIDNPFLENERIYKTGDFGKWLSDGTVEYLGRKDHQVKIRGFRIELGEIEAAILRYKKIKASVVLAKQQTNGESNLVAYFLSNEKCSIAELRQYLKTCLPEYMIPDFLIERESFPLNPNGKLDRKALPDPEGSDILTGVEYMAPRSETESTLIAIWEEVLGVENIGVLHDFFELGGHSLKAMRLLSNTFKKFNVRLELTDLFENSTVEKMSLLVERIIWLETEVDADNEMRI